ncbi:hypothetical protein ACNKHN_22870 [Shigella flexneri]
MRQKAKTIAPGHHGQPAGILQNRHRPIEALRYLFKKELIRGVNNWQHGYTTAIQLTQYLFSIK